MAVDKLVDSGQLDSDLTSVANAIRTKGGTSAQLAFPNEFVSAINAIPTGGGGGGGVEEKDVNFIDYDGTILHSYTKAEFANLSEMPANPSHEGLTAQGWNWELADAKTYVANSGGLMIGQMYVTNDNKTRIYISICKGTASNRKSFSLQFVQSVANGVTINWGDGTTETDDSTTGVIRTHNYSDFGDYVVTLTVNTGTCTISNSSNSVTGYQYFNADKIKKVEIGSNINLRNYCFQNCWCLESITLPNNTNLNNASYAFSSCPSLKALIVPTGSTEIPGRLIYYCRALKYVSLPKNAGTSISTYAFAYCESLKKLYFPESVTSLGTYVAAYNASITKLVIPSGITSIGNNAFGYCRNIGELHFKRTSPPTISSSNALNPNDSNNADWVIYVPYSADHSVLNAYKTASNWSTYASRMQEEPQ